MKRINIFILVVFSLAILLIFSGCMMPTKNLMISPSADFSTFKKIVLWEFKDGSVHVENSGNIMTMAIESALVDKGFTIIQLSRVRDAIGDKQYDNFDASMLTQSNLEKIKLDAGADGILFGVVNDAWCSSAWIPPCWIECTIQFFSTENGEKLLSGSFSEDGYGLQATADQIAKQMTQVLIK